MIRKTIYKIISHYIFPNKGVTHIKREPRIIVSLTSHPRRISTIVPVIDSLLRQTLKPDMLILWLAKEEFPQREQSLPERLRRYTKFGLQIKWCENLKSYKKIVPALIKYPEDIIVTADDDIIYSEDWLEKLFISHIKYPKQILGHHAYSYSLNQNNELEPPDVYTTSGLLDGIKILGSGGGALFPPHLLYKDTTNIELIQKVAPTNDDYWLWAMAHLNGTPIRLIDNFMDNIVCVKDTLNSGLWENTNSHGEGSRQFMNIINHYPQLKQYLS